MFGKLNNAIDESSADANRKFAITCAESVLTLFERVFQDDRPRRCIEAAKDYCRERGELEFTGADRSLDGCKRLTVAERQMKTATASCSKAGRVVPVDKARNSAWLMAREAAMATCERSPKVAARQTAYFTMRAITAAVSELESGDSVLPIQETREALNNLALDILHGNIQQS